jgi:hypothetical protein
VRSVREKLQSVVSQTNHRLHLRGLAPQMAAIRLASDDYIAIGAVVLIVSFCGA